MPSRLRAVGLVLLLGVTALSPLPHGALKNSTPGDKAVLSEVPRELRLTFNETPEPALTRIALRDSAGAQVALGKLDFAGSNRTTVVAPIAGRLTAGKYTVEWQIAGPDGHPVTGKFTFAITAEAIASATPAAGVDTGRRPADMMTVHHDTLDMPQSATRFDAESAGFVAVRFFLYSALLVVIGAVAFKMLVLGLVGKSPNSDPVFLVDAGRRAAAIGWAAALVLLAACVARLGAQSWALNGFNGLSASPIRILATETRWGVSWLAQIGATLLAAAGFAMARRAKSEPRRTGMGWMIVSLAAVVLAFTPAFASHAAAVPERRPVALLLDGLHIIGAAGWLGSLLVVLAAGIPAALALHPDRRGRAVADLFNAFSPTALAFAGLVAMTGLYAAWIHVGGFASLWEAKYGKLLLAKLAVLGIMALTGAYNWLRVKPALGTIEGIGRIRRSARTEVLVGIVVLVITSVLVATPTPMDKM